MSTIVKARSAGALYLLNLILSGLTLFYVPATYIVPGDSAATALKIKQAGAVYRLAIAADVSGAIIFILLILILYRVFKDVDNLQAMLMVIAVSIGAAYSLVDILFQIAPLVLLSGANYLSSFTAAQLDALAFTCLRLRTAGFEVVETFWALALWPLGVLIWKSRFSPRPIGVLLIAASVAGLTYSFGLMLAPAHRQIIA